MTTGAKVAIGCGIAILVTGLVVIAGVVGLGFWAKGKVEKMAEGEQRIEQLHKKADTHTFTAPADGILQEDRLLKFLDIRRRVFAVYLRHKDEIDAISKKKEGTLGDVTQSLGIFNEARLAKAEALADVEMSQGEYDYLVGQVYKSAWASEWQKGNEGQSGATTEEAEAARKRLEQNQPAVDQMAREMRQRAKELDVPPQNIALFRKHEAEIKKYAMGGLEWMGL